MKEYTKEEYKKLVNKGRRWLLEYLARLDKKSGKLSSGTKEELFRVIGSEYKRLMREDEAFFRRNEAFCSEKHFWNEKDEFFEKEMNNMVKSGNIHRKYAERNPDYTVPDRYKK